MNATSEATSSIKIMQNEIYQNVIDFWLRAPDHPRSALDDDQQSKN